MTRTMEFQENEDNLRDLITLVKAGDEIVLTENNRPVARIVGTETSIVEKRVAGFHRGAMKMSLDFDEPLPEEFWIGKE